MLAGCGGPQVDIATELEAVRARSQGVAAAEAAQDVAAALAFWAEDAIVQPAGAPQLQGKAALGDLYRQFFEGGQLKEFAGTTSHLEVSAAGDLAYEYGVNRMILAGPDGDLLDMGKYLVVWKKINGEWFAVALSFTSDTPAPVPLSVP
jgi:ketosteroid isomerase-like protein